MLYKYENKIYIKVGGHLLPVEIKKEKDDYKVTADRKTRIPTYGKEDKIFEVSLEKAYELANKNKELSDSSNNLKQL